MAQGYVRVKICGVTHPEDARVAEAAGADAIGVVMYSESPRSVSPDEAAAIFSALGPFVARVVVTHTSSREDLSEVLALHPTAVQVSYPHEVLAGCGTAVIRVIGREHPAPPLHADAYIVDESMGRGRLFDLISARRMVDESRVPVVLAGGLTPGNVRAAVRAVHPYAVDVCSGVETRPGVKDPALVRAFVAAVKG